MDRIWLDHVWTRPALFRCQWDQSCVLDPAATADSEFSAELECGPTDSLPVVRYDARAGERSHDMLRWGLVPFSAKDLNVGFANINAKAEGIETRLAFREAFQRRRCLVPVNSFTNGRRPGRARALRDRSRQRQPDGAGRPVGELALARGEWLRSFAIITTTLNELCAEVHNRIPVVKPETWPVWLGEGPAAASALKGLADAFPSDEMACWPASARVGNAKNNDSTLIEPIMQPHISGTAVAGAHALSWAYA